jgi:hypothetical protein
MERTAWTDARLDDAFTQLRAEMREFRAETRADMRAIRTELFQLKLFMLAGLVTILAAIIGLHG